MFQQMLNSVKFKLLNHLDSKNRVNTPISEDEVFAKDYSLFSGERQVADKFENIRKDHTIRYELALEIIKRNIKDKNIKMLDLFCGNGYGTYYLSESLKSSNVIGIDGSKEAIEFANEHYGNGNNLFSHKLFPFTLPKNTFDFILCFESLEHVEDDSKMLEELLDSLCEDGYAFISVPNQDKHPLEKNPHHFHYRHYLHDSFVNNLSDSFDLIEWYGQNVYHFDDSGINTMALIPEEEMKPKAFSHGQITIYLLRKRKKSEK